MESDYKQRVRRELLETRTGDTVGFTDDAGYVADFENGTLTTLGEGTLHTAIAAIALAADNFQQSEWETAEANNALLKRLKTLLDSSWGNVDGLGQSHPIRHPNVFDYDNDGNELRRSPMTKDSFGAIVVACLYSHRCPNSSDEVRATSVALIQKWIDYLVTHTWRTHSNFLVGEFESEEVDGEAKYKNIFQKDGGRVMFKGPESFMLLPHEILALQNVGSTLGQVTSGWNILTALAAEVRQQIVDIGAPYIGGVAEKGMRSVLDQLVLSIPYSIPLGTDQVNFGKLEGDFRFGIPGDTHSAIAASFGNAVRDLVKEAIELETLAILQPGALLGLAISKVLDLFPAAIGAENWRTILTSAMRQLLPWIDGTFWLEVAFLATTIELVKKLDTDEQSYTMWSIAAVFETRPEHTQILRPLVQELFSFLRGHGNPNGLWAWLAEDGGRVSEQLSTFEDKSPYNWDRFAYGSTPYDEWLDDAVPNPEDAARQSPRIDYLVLDGLREKGPPSDIVDVANTWFNEFRAAVEELLTKFLDAVNELLKTIGLTAIQGLSRIAFHVDSPLIPPIILHGDAGHGDVHGDLGHGDAHADAGHGDGHGDAGHADAHGDVGHGDMHGDAGHGDAHGDVTHGDSHGDGFLGQAHLDQGLGVHLDESFGGVHGDTSALGLHADGGPLGLHADSPSVGVHADNASVGYHVDSPLLNLHVDTAPVGHLDLHGDVENHGHFDSALTPHVDIDFSTPHGDAHGDAGHGDAHGDAGHGDAHGDIGHGDFHGDIGHGDLHGDVGHGDSHGDAPPVGGLHADWSGLGLHGDNSAVGIHGDSDSVGVHGDSESIGAHVDNPAIGLHGDIPSTEQKVAFPGLGHGDVHIDGADDDEDSTQELPPAPTHVDEASIDRPSESSMRRPRQRGKTDPDDKRRRQ